MTPEEAKPLADFGIHKTQEDLWEEELRAAHWQPQAAHPRSKTWLSPEGVLVPGPGYAWHLLQESKKATEENKRLISLHCVTSTAVLVTRSHSPQCIRT